MGGYIINILNVWEIRYAFSICLRKVWLGGRLGVMIYIFIMKFSNPSETWLKNITIWCGIKWVVVGNWVDLKNAKIEVEIMKIS